MSAPPDNNGYWIAYMPSDIPKLIDNLDELSCTWIAPRIDKTTDYNVLSRLKKANFKIYPWVYVFPSCDYTPMVSKLLDYDGFIIDAEVEFNNKNDAAKQLVNSIRNVIKDSWLAYAPFALPTYHQDFPYVEFGKVCNAVMPQLYAYEFDDSGYKYWISRYEEQWLKFELNYPEVKNDRLPIGCCYRPKKRGIHVTLPFDNNKLIKDVTDYCEYFSGGLYSYEAMIPEMYQAMVKARNPYA